VVLTAVAPSAGTGTVDVTVTAAAGTSPVDTTKDPFTCRVRIGRGIRRNSRTHTEGIVACVGW
jgi:hypothetical protein